MTEFRRAQNELKTTFSREMENLERETKQITQSTAEIQSDPYNYDYSTSYQSQYEGSNEPAVEITATDPSTESASAPEGAESPLAELPSGGNNAPRDSDSAASANPSGNCASMVWPNIVPLARTGNSAWAFRKARSSGVTARVA